MLGESTGDGFHGQKTRKPLDANRARRDYVTVGENKIVCDPDATDGRVPDAPARPKMEENALINKREEHSPSLSRTADRM